MTDISRPQLVHAFQEAVRGNVIAIRSPIALQECRGFVTQPDGKPGIADGSGDNCVWAAALAAYGLRFTSRSDQSGVRRLKGFEPLGERKRRGPDYGG
jgi:hypothetical protein